MTSYVKNLKSAVNKMGKNRNVAGNQLVFKEKEALLVTGTILFIPIATIVGTILLSKF